MPVVLDVNILLILRRIRLRKMINKKKILFWDRFFWTMVGLFIIPMILYVSSLDDLKNNEIFIIILGICLLISGVMSIIFRLGMSYNAYKIKRYGWMLSTLILGDIFMIIFYFAILKKQVNDIKKEKVEE